MLLWAAQGRADDVLVVRGGSLYATDDHLAALTPLASGRIVTAAYDQDGTVWYSRDPGGAHAGRCLLYRAGDASPHWRFDQLAGAVDKGFGLCYIESDPRGGLLFEADNGTGASVSVHHLDPASGTVALVGHGYSPAPYPDGSAILVVRHTYLRSAGSYEALWLAPPSAPDAAHRLSPVDETFAAPAFSPDGRLLAVAADGAGGLEVMNAEARTCHVVLQGASSRYYVTRVAWLSDGHTLLATATAQPGDMGPDVYRSDADLGGHDLLLRNVQWLSVRRVPQPVAGPVAAFTPLPTAGCPSSAPARVRPPRPPPGPLVIKASGRPFVLGGYKASQSASMRSAVAFFGAPSREIDRSGGGCVSVWSSLGVTITFENIYDPAASCASQRGLPNVARMRGRRWRTERGLRVGDPIAKLRRRYPTATFHGGEWWLITTHANLGSPHYYPVLAAEVHAGRVRAFRLCIDFGFEGGGEGC